MKLSAFFRKIVGPLFVFERIFVFEKALSKACFQARDQAITDVRLAQSDDISKIVNKFRRFRRGKAEERLKVGHLCFIAEKNGDIVHFKWVAFNGVYVKELERSIRLSSDSAYIYDAYTVPEYRGIGISPAVSARIFGYLFQKGIKKTYHFIRHDNFPSLRVAEKTGLQNVGEVTLIRLFKSSRYRYKAKTAEDCKKLKEMFSI